MRKPPLEEGQRWLEQAEEDLKWARLRAEQGGYHLACFHAQQVELKAFLLAQGEEIVMGHSVERAGRLLSGRPLSPQPSRQHPGEGVASEAAGRAVELAREAVEFVR